MALFLIAGCEPQDMEEAMQEQEAPARTQPAPTPPVPGPAERLNPIEKEPS